MRDRRAPAVRPPRRRAATLAAGGCWRALEPGARFSLQPLARINQEIERASASEWIAETVRLAGLEPVPRIREEIWAALEALAQAPAEQRTLTVFTALVQDKAVAAALDPSLVTTFGFNWQVDREGLFRGRTSGDRSRLQDPDKHTQVALGVDVPEFLGRFMTRVTAAAR